MEHFFFWPARFLIHFSIRVGWNFEYVCQSHQHLLSILHVRVRCVVYNIECCVFFFYNSSITNSPAIRRDRQLKLYCHVNNSEKVMKIIIAMLKSEQMTKECSHKF